MSNPAPAPERALALADYNTLTSLANAVDAAVHGRTRVAAARVSDLAFHASELARLAQEAETFLKVARVTGAAERHPEAFSAAEGGNASETYRIMVDALTPLMGG